MTDERFIDYRKAPAVCPDCGSEITVTEYRGHVGLSPADVVHMRGLGYDLTPGTYTTLADGWVCNTDPDHADPRVLLG